MWWRGTGLEPGGGGLTYNQAPCAFNTLLGAGAEPRWRSLAGCAHLGGWRRWTWGGCGAGRGEASNCCMGCRREASRARRLAGWRAGGKHGTAPRCNGPERPSPATQPCCISHSLTWSRAWVLAGALVGLVEAAGGRRGWEREQAAIRVRMRCRPTPLPSSPGRGASSPSSLVHGALQAALCGRCSGGDAGGALRAAGVWEVQLGRADGAAGGSGRERRRRRRQLTAAPLRPISPVRSRQHGLCQGQGSAGRARDSSAGRGPRPAARCRPAASPQTWGSRGQWCAAGPREKQGLTSQRRSPVCLGCLGTAER